MQTTRAFIHRHVFAGVDGATPDAQKRGHDYDDEHANFMDAFERIDLDDDHGDMDSSDPQPPSAPLDRGLSGQINIAETNPTTTSTLDNRNATAGPSRPRGRKKQTSEVELISMSGKGTDLAEPRVVRTRNAKGKGKAKA